jgi:hypothetical protein
MTREELHPGWLAQDLEAADEPRRGDVLPPEAPPAAYPVEDEEDGDPDDAFDFAVASF